MFFYIADFGVLSHVKAVNSVVLGVLAAAVVDAAARDDEHVAVFADEEIVVYHFFQPGGADDDGDVDGFVLSVVFDGDVNACSVLFGLNVDVGGGASPGETAVGAEVIGARGDVVQVGHFLDNSSLNGIKGYHEKVLLN